MPTDFLRAAQDPSQIRDIAPGAKSLEGFLFPATYNLPRHMAPAYLTSMMVHKFREALQQVAPDRLDPLTPGTPLLSVVTLASLVEAETPKRDERPLVAGVYTNRLHKRMLLQCDPTVIYALKQVDKYNRTLTLKDLHFDSRVQHLSARGLPPGPIGNPGEVSPSAPRSLPLRPISCISSPIPRAATFSPPHWRNTTKMWPNTTVS